MILIVLTVITLLIRVEPADAENYPWCAQRGDGATNCGFVSYGQCMAKQGTWCYRTPLPFDAVHESAYGTSRTFGRCPT